MTDYMNSTDRRVRKHLIQGNEPSSTTIGVTTNRIVIIIKELDTKNSSLKRKDPNKNVRLCYQDQIMTMNTFVFIHTHKKSIVMG